jgi:hypothetical protein
MIPCCPCRPFPFTFLLPRTICLGARFLPWNFYHVDLIQDFNMVEGNLPKAQKELSDKIEVAGGHCGHQHQHRRPHHHRKRARHR